MRFNVENVLSGVALETGIVQNINNSLYMLGDPVQEKMQHSLEQRMAIKFCVKLEKSAAETIPMLKKAFGVDCLSDRQIFRTAINLQFRRQCETCA
ncbi:hypothetical protein NQ318_023528 [Aromia moschata]|uniref:Uncharacterized protein n=1 Tax=Aromia moschata TaxID=1265417 RepID=A0AAV8YR53_9CUCU|nr:hypothetical protein NQ318_023528 [Aromia moschata]